MTPQATKVSDLNQLDWHRQCSLIQQAARTSPFVRCLPEASRMAAQGANAHAPEERKRVAQEILRLDLTGWRGGYARSVKQRLKEYAK